MIAYYICNIYYIFKINVTFIEYNTYCLICIHIMPIGIQSTGGLQGNRNDRKPRGNGNDGVSGALGIIGGEAFKENLVVDVGMERMSEHDLYNNVLQLFPSKNIYFMHQCYININSLFESIEFILGLFNL